MNLHPFQREYNEGLSGMAWEGPAFEALDPEDHRSAAEEGGHARHRARTCHDDFAAAYACAHVLSASQP
jgi:hypothetical protein